MAVRVTLALRTPIRRVKETRWAITPVIAFALLALLATPSTAELPPDVCGRLAEKYDIVAGVSSGTAKPRVMTAWRSKGCEFWICAFYRQQYPAEVAERRLDDLPADVRMAWLHTRPAGEGHDGGDCDAILAFDDEIRELLDIDDSIAPDPARNSLETAPHNDALQSDEQRPGVPVNGKPCPPGCEAHGTCNAELGVCRCPVGYGGADCSVALWSACKQDPREEEMYCGSFAPKSCECFRQCHASVCGNDTAGTCEFAFNVMGARCFERAPSHVVVVDGVEWNGGSSIPEEDEEGVEYFIGVPGVPPFTNGNEPKSVTRDQVLDMEPSMADGVFALPLARCPESCNLHGSCVARKLEKRPHCLCHYGFTGAQCELVEPGMVADRNCFADCNGRGRCRRGICQCHPGFWGRDCSSSKVFLPDSAVPVKHKLRIYVYDLPWEAAYRHEWAVGHNYNDFIYMAWNIFAERLFRDDVVRTHNPWEANLFYIPSMTLFYSSNLGDTVTHNRRSIDYVRHTWPFFNRTGGVDHFIFLTNDRGACWWPGAEEPHLANVMKIVHFAWSYNALINGTMQLPGWPQLPNRHWGCFNPLRDVVATPYWLDQDGWAKRTYGLLPNAEPLFQPNEVPKRLLFFSGGVRHESPDYSFGVRQTLHDMFGDGQHPDVVINEGRWAQYDDYVRNTKFCLAPAGHGWGIRLAQYMTVGCVPLIIQDGVYQAYDDVLPYQNFTVTLSSDDLPRIVETLSAISDEDYLALKAGVAQHWQHFVWDERIGRAYETTLLNLDARRLALNARKITAMVQGRTAR